MVNEMGQYHEVTFPVDSRDVDGLGRCKPSALLGYMQETATQAAILLNVGRDELITRYNAFWMLVRVWFRLKRPLTWQDRPTIRTWHRGDKSATMYRDYDIFVGNEHVGEGVSVWVLAGMEDRTLKRLSEVKEMETTHGGDLRKTIKLSKLKHPTDMQAVEQRVMHYSDTDINAHVNNTRYADFLCDAISDVCIDGSLFLAEMQINYISECRIGDVLTIKKAQNDGKHYISGNDDTGKIRFDGVAMFNKI